MKFVFHLHLKYLFKGEINHFLIFLKPWCCTSYFQSFDCIFNAHTYCMIFNILKLTIIAIFPFYKYLFQNK